MEASPFLTPGADEGATGPTGNDPRIGNPSSHEPDESGEVGGGTPPATPADEPSLEPAGTGADTGLPDETTAHGGETADIARARASSYTKLAVQTEDVSADAERYSKQIRELMRSLVRALKAKKMYPANNPVLSRIVTEFQDLMIDVLGEIDDLSLSIDSTELRYEGHSVYQNASKRDSLAYRFHRDGITDLSFTEGITRPELNAFLDVLATATEPSGAEEDLVTILWEQEFAHIRYSYIAIDDLQEGLLDELESTDDVDPEEAEMREVPWPQGEVTNYNIVIDSETAASEGSGERSDDWAQLEPAMDITERCPAHLLEISDNELQALAEEVHLEHSRPLTESALEILTEVAEEEQNPERFAELARALSELVVIALADADFARAAQILATLMTMTAERNIDANSFLPESRELITQAMASLQHTPEADTSSIPEFLAHLGPRAVDPVCDLLCDKDLEHLQPILASGLSLLAAQNLPRIQRRLQDATGAAARHILAAAASSPFPDADRVIAIAASHKEPRVRTEALKFLVQRKALSKPESIKGITAALNDKDPQVRGSALIAVRQAPTEEMGPHLLEMVEGKRFREMTQSERVAYFETLVTIPGESTRHTLREWATRPIWWPNGDQAERRSLAAKALSRSKNPDDRDLLEKNAKSLFPGVRKANQEAVENLNRMMSRPAIQGDQASVTETLEEDTVVSNEAPATSETPTASEAPAQSEPPKANEPPARKRPTMLRRKQ